MNITFPIGKVMNPRGMAVFAVVLSFCAWLCPDFEVLRKGFTVREQPGLIAWLILISWYVLIFTSLYLGQRAGAFFAGRHRRFSPPSLDSVGLYRIFTALAAVGTISTLFRIFQTLSLPQAALYFYLGQANRIKNTLYDNYSAGILSLRYLVVYSASLAIYRTIRFRKLTFLNIANAFLLAGTVLISSRLILVATLVTSFFLLTWGKDYIRISLPKLAAWLAIVFAILSLLNTSRNRNFYSNRDLSFTQAGISEIITYLGSPFNVAAGAARRLDEISVGDDPELYREYVDIEPELSTNSAFVHLHAEMGYFSWPYICVVCGFMGFLFSWLTSFGKTGFLLPCAAILYACAELWRLDLFQQGIFIVWLACGIAVPLLSLLFRKESRPVSLAPTVAS
jgi:hypothetical protein